MTETRVTRKAKQANLVHMFQDLQQQDGSTVDAEVHAWRFQVVSALLACCIPLYRLDDPHLKELLEDGHPSVTTSSSMRSYIPKVESHQINLLLKELAEPIVQTPSNAARSESNSIMQHSKRLSRRVTVIFDGSKFETEAYAVLFRFVMSGRICQRLARFQLLQQSVNAPELANVLTQTLQNYEIDLNRVFCFIRDRASTNSAALDLIKGAFLNAVDVGCFSHTLANTGKAAAFQSLARFLVGWNSIIQSYLGMYCLASDQNGTQS